jgi:hypothetical protein
MLTATAYRKARISHYGARACRQPTSNAADINIDGLILSSKTKAY